MFVLLLPRGFYGVGFDGLVQATALTMLHPTLPVHIGVYLLPLRHPVPVARQLADISQLAPGRLVLGVGVGGEDRHEIEVCGVYRATRGQRMDECSTILRQLLTGAPTTVHGKFFDVDDAVIAPPAAVPILVGGRSDVAVRRAGRLGDGWLGVWNLPRGSPPPWRWPRRKPARLARPTRRRGTPCRCGAGSRTRRARPAPAWPRPWKPCTSCRSSALSGTAVRHPRRRGRVPRALRRGRLHGVQPDPAVTRPGPRRR